MVSKLAQLFLFYPSISPYLHQVRIKEGPSSDPYPKNSSENLLLVSTSLDGHLGYRSGDAHPSNHSGGATIYSH